jgi:hypothetical protein
MKLARLTCPGCKSPYETAISREAYFAQCPSCGQNNNVPLESPIITGLCLNCSRALDDHHWRGEYVVHCP